MAPNDLPNPGGQAERHRSFGNSPTLRPNRLEEMPERGAAKLYWYQSGTLNGPKGSLDPSHCTYLDELGQLTRYSDFGKSIDRSTLPLP